jgi:hypothetical protein
MEKGSHMDRISARGCKSYRRGVHFCPEGGAFSGKGVQILETVENTTNGAGSIRLLTPFAINVEPFTGRLSLFYSAILVQ